MKNNAVGGFKISKTHKLASHFTNVQKKNSSLLEENDFNLFNVKQEQNAPAHKKGFSMKDTNTPMDHF